MATTFDLSDVPAADAADLAAAMRTLVENGRGLILLNGAGEADLDAARATLQQRYHGEPHRALTAFVRFRHLVEVFGARRLQQLLLDNGHSLIAPAIAVAAKLRLNAHRGFNPQSFLTALTGTLVDNVVKIETRRVVVASSVEDRVAA
jgi:hypothetical protein